MSRLSGLFARLNGLQKRALIPYVVAGDPTVSVTVELMHRVVAAGADVLEVGVPFSDPMSEGLVIQLGHERALANGMTLRGVLDIIAQFRQDNEETPVVLMGYANPIERFGYDAFAEASAAAGVDGLITVDLPPEEVDRLDQALIRVGIDNILLISPTTERERVQKIVARARGFIYYVAVKGVTGSGRLDVSEVAERVGMIRELTALPVAVGFGIKDAESAAQIAEVADAVVVGSALIDEMVKKSQADAGSEEIQIHQAAVQLLQRIRAGVDSSRF